MHRVRGVRERHVFEFLAGTLHELLHLLRLEVRDRAAQHACVRIDCPAVMREQNRDLHFPEHLLVMAALCDGPVVEGARPLGIIFLHALRRLGADRVGGRDGASSGRCALEPGPVADAPLIAQKPGRPRKVLSRFRLANPRAEKWRQLRGKEWRVFVVRASNHAGRRIGGHPSRQHAAGRATADDDGALDDEVNKPDQIVRHIVERVWSWCPGAAALATQINGEDLKVGSE